MSVTISDEQIKAIAQAIQDSGNIFADEPPTELTRLVILCHDRLLRMEIEGRRKGWLTLVFYQREGRDGPIGKRHPTIEQAIANTRRYTDGTASSL